MAWWSGSNRTPIGIDAHGRFVNAVQLARSGAGWRLRSALTQPRTRPGEPIDADEIEALADLLERRGFQGRDVVLAMPGESLRTETVRVASKTPAHAVPQHVRAAVAASHRCEADDIECAWWDRPASPGTIVAMGCRTARANMLTDIVETGGLRLRGLDAQAWALARACGPRVADTQGVAAVLNIEWSVATLVVLCEGVVAYERTLTESGVNRLQASMMNRLSLDRDVCQYILDEVGLRSDAEGDLRPHLLVEAHAQIRTYLERLQADLQQSLTYAGQEFPDRLFDRVLMVGEGAAIPEVPERLADLLEQDVQPVAPCDVVRCRSADDARSGSPLLMTALGLAQYGRE